MRRWDDEIQILTVTDFVPLFGGGTALFLKLSLGEITDVRTSSSMTSVSPKVSVILCTRP